MHVIEKNNDFFVSLSYDLEVDVDLPYLTSLYKKALKPILGRYRIIE